MDLPGGDQALEQHRNFAARYRVGAFENRCGFGEHEVGHKKRFAPARGAVDERRGTLAFVLVVDDEIADKDRGIDTNHSGFSGMRIAAFMPLTVMSRRRGRTEPRS